jgi:hypothetical protein
MIIIIIKFPCEIIILQIYDRNKYYIIEVPDINYNICSTFIKEFPGINLYNICSISIYLPILVLCSYLPVQIFKKRMLNVIIISLQSVNEWPVFNLKKNILTNILRLTGR